MEKNLTLSIIIVKYRCEKYLKQCLDSIKKDNRWETVVVDNDQNNIGYGAGCNKGAKKAKGEYLLFLNPDTIVLDDSLEKMIQFMKDNPSVAVLGPKIYQNFRGEKQLSFCRFPDPLTSLFVFSPVRSFWQDNPLFSRYVYAENKKDNGICDVEAVAGAALLVRKEVFDKVGGFDEKFFLYFEENDLCRRVKKLDYKIIYFPEAEIVHFGGKSTVDTEKACSIFKESRFYFFKKHYGEIVAVLTEGPIRFLEAAAKR